jgi:hypothetical protein
MVGIKVAPHEQTRTCNFDPDVVNGVDSLGCFLLSRGAAEGL